MTAYKQKEDEIIVRKNTLDLKGVLVPRQCAGDERSIMQQFAILIARII